MGALCGLLYAGFWQGFPKFLRDPGSHLGGGFVRPALRRFLAALSFAIFTVFRLPIEPQSMAVFCYETRTRITGPRTVPVSLNRYGGDDG